MFIVTNKPSHPTFKILDHLQMLHFFADVISPDTGTHPYSSKSAICQHILTKYQINQQSAILVGDSRDDAQAAKSCGLSFIAATYGYGKVHESETSEQLCKIYSFPELIGLIKH
jgi:phosphoglycolate phosphatase